MNRLFRHSYQNEAPHPLEKIEEGINGLEKEILAMLREVV